MKDNKNGIAKTLLQRGWSGLEKMRRT